MNDFQAALLIAAVAVAVISWRVPRAWLWIALGAANFTVTTAYARYGFPVPPFFTLCVDTGMCLVIIAVARERWEFPLLYLCFQGMVMVGIAHMFALYFMGINPHYAYVTALEVLNWAALAIIGGTAILQWVDSHDLVHDRWRGDFRRAHHALHAPRDDNAAG